MRALQLLKRIVLGAIGAILGVYLVFAIGLTVLEWIVRENPKVEQSLRAHSTAPHLITHYDQGAASFQRRLELIGAARTSIALEFFIYDVDDASRLITQALIKRAREGVQVRILVDFSAPVFQLKPAYARLLGEAGVKVRYYNTSAIYRLVSIQHRSHRKLLIVDGETVLTGGRNIANDYFDLSDRYNFLDSDLEISGPIVKTMLESFDVYWNSRLATEPVPDPNRTPRRRSSWYRTRATPPCSSEAARGGRVVPSVPQGSRMPRPPLRHGFPEPGGGEPERVQCHRRGAAPRETRGGGGIAVLRDQERRLRRARGPAQTGRGCARAHQQPRLHRRLVLRGARSIPGSAHWPIPASRSPRMAEQPLPSQSTNLGGGTPRWGLHAKRGVIDGDTTLLGTYNIDPRSANLNSELMLVCRGQKELAAEVLASIAAREAASGQGHRARHDRATLGPSRRARR